jgi:sugar phosphate isomerase/epimerase
MRLGRIQNNYTKEGFELVAAQGLDFIEICRNNQAEAEDLIASKNSVKELIKQTGIDVSSVGRCNHDILEGGAIAAEKLEHYLAFLDCAIELGAKTFV